MTTNTKNQSLHALEQQILQSIPLSRTLGFHIKELTNQLIVVEAPLEPNINVHGTAFAGSLYSLAVLTAWGLAAHVVSQSHCVADLVIAKADIRYRLPVKNSITCSCCVSEELSKRFSRSLKNLGHGKLNLSVDIGDSAQASLNAVMIAKQKAD